MGREEELALASELLERGEGGIVLAGAAGVGKTRLAREILDQAEAKGDAKAWVVATQAAASIPYGALAHLLSLPVSEAGGPLAFLQRAVATLAERAGGGRLALAIDDAHLLDDLSANFVHHVAATTAVSVVAVIRTGEPAPDSIVALWKEGLCDRLEVQPLSPNEVEELLVDVLGDQVDGRTLRDLWRTGGGNPLFLRELVLGGLETGALAKSGGVWKWRGSVAVPRLVELTELRLAALSAEERAALELVAVGEPLETEILAALVDADVLERAERRSLLEFDRDRSRGVVRLAHPLYGEIVRARVPAFRARELHRRLAQALERAGARRRNDVLRIAAHRLAGGGGVGPDVLIAAAREAEAAFDHVLAERLARRATEVGGGVGAGIVLGRSLQEQGRSSEAEAVLSGLTSKARTDAERAELAELRAGNLFWGLGYVSDAEQVLRQGEQAIADRSRREDLLSLRVGFACAAGRPWDALEAAAPILEAKEASRRAVLRTLLHAVPGLAIVGRPESALVAAERGGEAARALGETLPFAPGHLVIGRLLALRLAGRLNEAAQAGMETSHSRGVSSSATAVAARAGVRALSQQTERARARASARRALAAFPAARWAAEASLADSAASRSAPSSSNLRAAISSSSPLRSASADAWSAKSGKSGPSLAAAIASSSETAGCGWPRRARSWKAIAAKAACPRA